MIFLLKSINKVSVINVSSHSQTSLHFWHKASLVMVNYFLNVMLEFIC